MTPPVQYHYGKFPPKNIDWLRLIPLIGPANAALARYDGTLAAIPNPSILLAPLTTQEAVLSSKIEGTQATMGEVLEFEAEGGSNDLPQQKKADINEVLNYRKAMRHAEGLLNTLPLCQRVIKEAHRVLLAEVRGHSAARGEYRKVPNWTGPPDCSIEEARFVPISAEHLQEAMGADGRISFMRKCQTVWRSLPVLHAELEALHPFLDGNGRLGRMFIPLFLHAAGLIRAPMFYISAYFERERAEYYARLAAVSSDEDWTGWCEFFLKAVIDQAEENQCKAASILKLSEDKKRQLVDLTHSQYAIHALDFFFSRPVFNATDFTSAKDIPAATAKRILVLLRDSGMLKTVREAKGRRPAVYAFLELIDVAEGRVSR